MFIELRKLCEQSSINFEDFLDHNYFISDQHEQILNTLVNTIDWRRDADAMFKRIRTLSKNQTLSVRQIGTLKRLSQQAMKNNEELTVKSIIHLFPGKTTTTLKLCIDQISRSLQA